MQELQGAAKGSPLVVQKMCPSLDGFAEYVDPASSDGFRDAFALHIVSRQGIHR